MTIETAGVRIRINPRHAYTERLCQEYLAAEGPEAEMTIALTEEEIRRGMARMAPGTRDAGIAESTVIYEKICNAMPKYNAFVMHAAAVAVDGGAYAFAAESGTGKSTHIGYWREILGDRMTVINGDKPICRFMEDGELRIFGTPWRGKEGWGTRTSAPLRAVCLLERGTENGIAPIGGSGLWGKIYPHFHVNQPAETDLPRMMGLIGRMMRETPFYRLRCRNEVGAAEMAIRFLLPGLRLQDR